MKTLFLHKNKEISLEEFIKKYLKFFSNSRQARKCAEAAYMRFYMLDTYGDKYQALKNVDKKGRLYFTFTEWQVNWYFRIKDGYYCSYEIKRIKVS